MDKIHQTLRLALPLVFASIVFYICLHLRAPALGRAFQDLANRPMSRILVPEASFAASSVTGNSFIELVDGMTYFLAAFMTVFLLLSEEKLHREVALMVVGIGAWILFLVFVVA